MSIAAAPAPVPDRTLAAAGAILGYAAIISFTDNHVRIVAAEAGLWQFHVLRSVIAVAVLLLAALALGLRLRPVRAGAVAARSGVFAASMLIYFGCLGFLSVAQVAAGLFTAPIWVLLIGRFVYGHRLGPVRILAALAGFAGVVLVLAPGGGAALGWAGILPVAAGALYALGNIATREWCAQESAATLALAFFVAMGLAGLGGLVLMGWAAPEVPPGADGFILRGWVWPSGNVWFWIVVQAVAAPLGIALAAQAYLIAEASRVSIFEYVILPFSAFWGWLIWGETITPVMALGMALIAGAGMMIALRGR